MANGSDEDEDVVALSNPVFPDDLRAKYMSDALKMKPTRGYHEYFGVKAPRMRVIHVLVQLPDQVPSPAASSSVSILEAIQQQVAQTQEQVLMLTEEKQKDVSIAKMSTKKGKQLTQALHLHVEEVKKSEPTVEESDPDNAMYIWLDRDEYDPAQVKAYMTYLNSNLRYYLADRKLELVEVHDMPDLLDVIDDRLPFDLKGTTDVLVMAEGCLPHNMTDVRLLIEVKK
jgi:hypothetical protein